MPVTFHQSTVDTDFDAPGEPAKAKPQRQKTHSGGLGGAGLAVTSVGRNVSEEARQDAMKARLSADVKGGKLKRMATTAKLDDHTKYLGTEDREKGEAVKAMARDKQGVRTLNRAKTTLFSAVESDRLLKDEISKEERERVLPLLRASPLLQHISDEGLDELLERSAMRNYRAGEPMIGEDSQAADVFLILSGDLEISRTELGPQGEDAQKAARALEAEAKDLAKKPSERLSEAELLLSLTPKEKDTQAYADWIDSGGLQVADKAWEERKKAHRTSKKSPETVLRRLYDRSHGKDTSLTYAQGEYTPGTSHVTRHVPSMPSEGAIIGEHSALFGKASASVWARSHGVETLAIEAKAFYEFVALSPGRDFSREWSASVEWVDAMLAACHTDDQGAQVLGLLQARLEAVLRDPCAMFPDGVATDAGWADVLTGIEKRAEQLIYALSHLSEKARRALQPLFITREQHAREDGRRYEDFVREETRHANAQREAIRAKEPVALWPKLLEAKSELSRSLVVDEQNVTKYSIGADKNVKGAYPWHFKKVVTEQKIFSDVSGFFSKLRPLTETEEPPPMNKEQIHEAALLRVAKMRKSAQDRTLKQVAEVLIHESAWLPAYPKPSEILPSRAAEVAILRKRWIEAKHEVLDQERAREPYVPSLLSIEGVVADRWEGVF